VLPANVETRLVVVLGVGVAASMIAGPVEPYLNHAVHVGGLLTGLLLAMAVDPKVPARKAPVAGGVAAALVVVSICGFLLASKWTMDGTLPDAVIRAEDHLSAEDPESAISILEGALLRDPQGSAETGLYRAMAQNALAWSYVEVDRELERGIQMAEASSAALPGSPEILDTLGYLYARAGRCDAAADVMGRAVEGHSGYGRRRDEVVRACDAKDRPNPDLPVDPLPTREELEEQERLDDEEKQKKQRRNRPVDPIRA
jgi:hypothetical protein